MPLTMDFLTSELERDRGLKRKLETEELEDVPKKRKLEDNPKNKTRANPPKLSPDVTRRSILPTLVNLQRFKELKAKFPPPKVDVANTRYMDMTLAEKEEMLVRASNICRRTSGSKVLGVKKGASLKDVFEAYTKKIKDWITKYGSFRKTPFVLKKYQDAYLHLRRKTLRVSI